MNLYGLTDEQMLEVHQEVEKEIFTSVYRNALKELMKTYDEEDCEKILKEFEFDEFVDGQYQHKKYVDDIDFMQTGYTYEIEALREAIKEDLDI